MISDTKIFREKLFSDWLPSFCDGRADEFKVVGFVEDSLDRLSDFDAHWFFARNRDGIYEGR